MKRRVLGIVLAIVLAAVGTLLLVSYVKHAKDDAVKDEEQVQVLVVNRAIAQGTAVADMSGSVTLTEVPKRLVAVDALSDLAQVAPTLVAAIELRPGDQLVSSRLVEPRSLVSVTVPDGLQEVTIALDPQRAVGGALQPGSLVGVVMSFDPFSSSDAGIAPAPDDTSVSLNTPNSTHLTLQKVLVTSVQLSSGDAERVSGDTTDTTLPATVNQAPADQLLITLAVSASDAEQIVFAAEFGHIWLTLQSDSTSVDGTRIITFNQAYITVER